MIHLQEHDILCLDGSPAAKSERFNRLSLVQWGTPFPKMNEGYYASFKIGAEWVDDAEALVVTTKRQMEHIDFLQMFMACFASDLSLDSLAKIYSIDVSKPPIYAPSLSTVMSPLIVAHFIGVVSRIKVLKRDYVRRQENLKKVKGRILLLKNERTNIVTKRFDHIYCDYSDYSVDIPENRLIKKALLFAKGLLCSWHQSTPSLESVRALLAQCLSRFEQVSDEVDLRAVQQLHSHKLFNEYSEAIRLAKLILRRFDYSISRTTAHSDYVTPFVLDMSLLYEHYVYGLLHEAYPQCISYQFKGQTGIPDFLYKDGSLRAILDTKYSPRYAHSSLSTDVVRQLSGYSRDLCILRYLGFDALTEQSPVPSVPCIIIYPTEEAPPVSSDGKHQGSRPHNLFLRHGLMDLAQPKKNLAQFYQLAVPLPMLL